MTFYFEELTLVVGLLMQSGAALEPDDVICMTRNIYQEARGEPLSGRIAVAYVTLARVSDDPARDSVCEVVGARRNGVSQFSWVSDAEMPMPSDWASYERSMLLAIAVMNGNLMNPTPGATHFYAPAKVTPGWADDLTEIAVIGHHRFMKE